MTEEKQPIKKKKGSPQKNKGKRGESFFADILTDISGLHFQRTFTSGAFTGGSNRQRINRLTLGQTINNIGDITPPEILKYLLIFESKNYEEVFIHQLIQGHCKQIFGWLDEIMFDVNSAFLSIKKFPLGFLCIKYTSKGNFVVVNQGMMYKQFGKFALPTNHIKFLYANVPDDLQKNGWNDMFYLFDFKLFFEANKKILFQKMSDEEILATIKNQ